MEHEETPLYYGRIEKVVDPMAGSGTVHDVVQWYNKRFHRNITCLSYDIAPRREFITQNDLDNGLPEEAWDCDLIFLDPPYYNMKTNLYVTKSYDGYTHFYSKVRLWAKACHDTLKPGGICALLIEDHWDWNKTRYQEPLSVKSFVLFLKAGFRHRFRLSVPVRHPKAQSDRQFKIMKRDLWILEKVRK